MNGHKRNYTLLAILLLGIWATGPGTAVATSEEDVLTVAVPNSLYAKIQHGRPSGIIVEAVAHALEGMGYSLQYVSMPTNEMEDALQAGAIDVATSLLLTADEGNGVLPSDPIIRSYSILLVRRGESFPVTSISDLGGKRIGGRVGYRYPMVERYTRIKLQLNRSDGENIRKLLLKDLDAALVGSISDLYEFLAEGLLAKLEALDTAVGYVDLGAVLSEQRFNEQDLQLFNEGIAELQASQAWQDILGNNGLLDLVKEWPVVAGE